MRAFALALSLALLAPSIASAQAPLPQDDSRVLAQQAKTAFDAGDFATAASLLERAYAAKPWPVFLYNLGRTYQQGGNKAKAVDAYERYLAAEPRSPDAGAVRESIRALRAEIDREAALEQQAVAEKERATEQALAADRARVEMESARRQAEQARHGPSAWPWVVTGVGLSGVAAGAVLGVLSKSAHSSAVTDASASQAQADQSSAHALAVSANVLFVAGAAVGVVGVVWGIFDLRVALGGGVHAAALPGAVVVGGAF